MNKFSNLILESNGYKYGCLMCQLNIEDFQSQFRPFTINKEHIYDTEEKKFGIENEPHITVLYGLHSDEIQDYRIEEWIQDFLSDPVDIALKEVSLFENDEYDVVKWDIDSERLCEMNSKMTENFPYTTDYPDYHPHATIMYANKGTGSNYAYTPETPILMKSNTFKYSKPTGSPIYYRR